jgi:DNA-binding transcriptional LysR family regulator
MHKPSMVQLQALRSIGRFRSFSRAAQAMGVSQPAVSQQIAALQRSLGLKLVDVVGNRAVLTEAGRFVSDRAELVIRELDALLRDTREFASAERGMLEFSATLTIGTYIVPKLIASFRQRHPAVTACVAIANTSAVAAAVLSGSAPLGLVEGPVDDEWLEHVPFATDRMVLVVPARGHRLSQTARVRPEDLAGEAFVSREPGSGTRGLGYEALHRLELATHIAVELPSGEAILRAVECGIGLAVLSEHVVERAVALGTVRTVEIEGVDLTRHYCLMTLRGRTLSPLAQAFAELVLDGID